ncbi:hypothetical protein [Runella slithyformis]|uniref:hypothetical protein n=1 Tax=Runella slithyformis TaxID=106 RepID=UPI00030373CA|nr:hypothetical protein [Runella slithyformis]
MLKKSPFFKNLLFFSVLVAIGGCSLSSDSLSLRAGLNPPSLKSSATKCKEGDLLCCKKAAERSSRTRPVI